MRKALHLVSVLLLAVACAKGGAGEASSKGGAAATITLGKLGLKATVPEGAQVSDGLGDGVTVMGPGIVLSVETASDSRPRTSADAEKDASMFTPKNLKSEALSDGWAMTFDNEGGMGKNYFVQARREIGGKSIWCETTASTPDQQSAALAACKSLKP